MKTCENTSNPRPGRFFLPVGFIGLFAALATNLVALYGFEKPHAVFFSGEWWTVWFPSYVIWSSFAFMGVAMWVADRFRR